MSWNAIFLVVSGSLASWLIVLVYTVFHRLYLSPIALFPGPRLAAVTYWYEFYYDIVLDGRYVFHIAELHKKYGPVIRISPDELHCADSDFHSELFTGSQRKRDKWEATLVGLGVRTSISGTPDHQLHRLRRSVMNPSFSKASVVGLQPLLERKVNSFMESLQRAQGSRKLVTISNAFAAFSNDIITNYVFGFDYDRLSKPDFDHAFHDNLIRGTHAASLVRFFPWILTTLEKLPSFLVRLIVPAYNMFLAEKAAIGTLIDRLADIGPQGNQDDTSCTVLRTLLTSKLPPSEKATPRLSDEAGFLVGAGTLTTAWTLSVATYFLLAQPNVLLKLKEELEIAIPDPSISVPVSKLDNLPYLNAVISEALRLSYGNTSRLQRIAINEVLVVRSRDQSWHIPPGTPVSMTSILMHHDETKFPNSHEFDPERWLGHPELNKYLVAFSKGSRHCLGINLAYAELYMMIAIVFRNFGSAGCRRPGDKGTLALYETDHRDIELLADKGVPGVREDTKGIRIQVID